MKSKKAKSKKQSRPSRKTADRRPVVYLVGDVENVLEYASLCTTHGYAVVCNWNEYPVLSPPMPQVTIKREKNAPRDASFALEARLLL